MLTKHLQTVVIRIESRLYDVDGTISPERPKLIETIRIRGRNNSHTRRLTRCGRGCGCTDGATCRSKRDRIASRDLIHLKRTDQVCSLRAVIPYGDEGVLSKLALEIQ